MTFALRMTYRELRASWRRLVFFVLCLSLGVGSIVLVRSAIQSINAYTTREARAINGADIVLRSARPWSDRAIGDIERIAAEPGVQERTETIEIPTMMRPVAGADVAKIVELKGVGPDYPVYGQLLLSGGLTYDPALLANQGALLSPSIAAQLDVAPGDSVRIGDRPFTVRGLIDREPDAGIGAFSLGSRVIISIDDLRASGLLGFSGRTRFTTLLKVDEGSYESTLASLKNALRTDLATVRGYRESEAAANAQLASSSDYLSLVGLAILVLGGVGIWSVTRVYIAERWRTIAILKCLGSSNASAVFAYTLQMFVIGVVGGLAGIVLAWLALRGVAVAIAGGPLATIPVALAPSAVAQGMAVGILVAMLFSLTPLLGIRNIKPNLVLRSADPRGVSRWDPARIVALVVVTVGTVAVSAWQSGSLRIGITFLVGLVVTGGVSALAGDALIRLASLARRVPSFPLRHALHGLRRPGNQTRAVLVSIGLGVFFLVGSFGVRATLLQTIDTRRSADLPDMYLADVQQDQRDAVIAVVRNATGTNPEMVSTLRARITALDGKPIDLDAVKDPGDRGRLGREYTVTSRYELDEHEKVTAGEWWDATPTTEPEISIDESLSRDFELPVGKTMTFDFQGRKITARISSVRSVDWQNARLGFMIVFRPGSLDNLSEVFIGALKGPDDAGDRGRLARAIADVAPNVSVIDARDIIQAIDRILRAITTALNIIGAIVLVAGLLILAGSVAMSRYVREHETAVLKTLGAGSRTILGLLLTEHAVIGTLAGLVGAILGTVMAWVISDQLFKLPWHFGFAIPLAGIAGSMVLATVAGMASSVDLLVLKPLGVLRRGD